MLERLLLPAVGVTRSLSKIIKSKYLVIKEPRMLSNFEPESGKGLAEIRNNETLVEPDKRELEVEELRTEVAEVIREAEDMVKEILENARAEAQQVIASAEEEADRIKNLARQEAELIKKHSWEEGYREGQEKAFQEIEDLRSKTLLECHQMVEEARKTKESIIRSAEEDIVNLALAIARKIIDKEVRENSDIIINLIRSTLAMVGNAGNSKILVNSHDFETVAENRFSLASPGQAIEHLEVQLDNRITPGGFIIESDVGIVDAQLETRISKVAEALMGEAGNSGESNHT